ncbi:hypothetical protein KOR42_37180 [Thalassoglobus neptunius]|uniref:Metallo-beta-lactamase domain-containing protein n=1 Tax=Thalassoglobus neptunius TaxID=1938619 RepID=A0A5C5WGW1_9PLAN|nr:hypothetical protein [Thalassoglobus neptunius]TWT50034.1 hypothetical protein KOR42_37180 [Thalassoglobus neptunius]
MTIFICRTCGTSFDDRPEPPNSCPICCDDRQFVPRSGQEWTTRESLPGRYANLWKQHEPNLFEIRTTPKFGIGQRAFLLTLPEGNYLWDCIALLDDATRHLIHALGGLKGIAISHPHYYTTMQDWAEEFDAPVHLHSDDREWVMRPTRTFSFGMETLFQSAMASNSSAWEVTFRAERFFIGNRRTTDRGSY